VKYLYCCLLAITNTHYCRYQQDAQEFGRFLFMQLLEEEDDALDYSDDNDTDNDTVSSIDSSGSVVKAGAVGAAVKQLFGGTLVNYMEVSVGVSLNT
jgi:hypothetical protein